MAEAAEAQAKAAQAAKAKAEAEAAAEAKRLQEAEALQAQKVLEEATKKQEQEKAEELARLQKAEEERLEQERLAAEETPEQRLARLAAEKSARAKKRNKVGPRVKNHCVHRDTISRQLSSFPSNRAAILRNQTHLEGRREEHPKEGRTCGEAAQSRRFQEHAAGQEKTTKA